MRLGVEAGVELRLAVAMGRNATDLDVFFCWEVDSVKRVAMQPLMVDIVHSVVNFVSPLYY